MVAAGPAGVHFSLTAIPAIWSDKYNGQKCANRFCPLSTRAERRMCMEITRNEHAKLQEMCDCFLETDYLAEMEAMSGAPTADPEEDARKYLSLAIMHTISEKARKLTLKRVAGQVEVKVKNENKELLPTPPPELFDEMVGIMRRILHLEENQGELPLILGLRSGQLEITVKVHHEPDKDSLKFKFPEL
jgi:hypothetical protein